MNGVQKRFDLTGKTALVTAAAGGFGEAISLGLAESGASVLVTDIREDGVEELAEQINKLGHRAICAPCDIKNLDQMNNVVDLAVREFGRIDILVNIAGYAVLGSILEMSAEDFDLTVNSSLKGAFQISQSVGRVMVENGHGGSIIHISSIAAARALGRGTGIYAATKAGINALVRELAVEWAPHSIRVNAIAPCQFRTNSFEKILNNPEYGGPEALTEKLLSRIPLGRFGEPDEIVGPCVFLASDASSMVTGHVLAVDGGYLAK